MPFAKDLIRTSYEAFRALFTIKPYWNALHPFELLLSVYQRIDTRRAAYYSLVGRGFYGATLALGNLLRLIFKVVATVIREVGLALKSLCCLLGAITLYALERTGLKKSPSPIDIQTTKDTLTATQPIEAETGLQKQIQLQLAETGSEVIVKHTIWNRGLLPVEIAAWTPTVMAPTGLGVTGFPPRGTHPEDLEPTNPLIMWAFTDLSDPRWKFTKKYLTLRQDPANHSPQKLGHWYRHTFGAYFLGGDVFLKEYFPAAGMQHPEFGASFEIFTNQDFLELETMGPFRKLAKDESLIHIEYWSLHKATLEAVTDQALDAALLPLLKK